MNKLTRFLLDETGQGMTEYGLVLGVISIAAISSIGFLRDNIVQMFEHALQVVTGAETGN